LWDETRVRPEDIQFFRGDNAYLWQLRGRNNNVMGYALTFYDLLSIDRLGFIEALDEDEAFGALSSVIGNRRVSRDLLDSVNELYFLERHLRLSTRTDYPCWTSARVTGASRTGC
jgi:hypothetical protein